MFYDLAYAFPVLLSLYDCMAVSLRLVIGLRVVMLRGIVAFCICIFSSTFYFDAAAFELYIV